MKEPQEATNDWPVGNILWFAVMIWFSSSLLSQTAYLAIYGLPYDATALLKSLGPIYYFVLVLELAMWGGLFAMGGYKFYRSRQVPMSNPLTIPVGQ